MGTNDTKTNVLQPLQGMIPIANSGSAILARAIITIAGIGLAVAEDDIAATTGTGAAFIDDGVRVAKTTSQAWAVGQKVYYNASTAKFTTSLAAGSYYGGRVYKAGASADDYGYIILERFSAEGPRYITDATDAIALTAADFESGHCTLVASVAGTATVTLPPVATTRLGARLSVYKSGSAGAITLDGNASETVAGGATYASIDALGDRATFINTGAAWILESATLA